MAIGVIWYPEGIDRQTYDATRDHVLSAASEKGLKFHAGGEGDGAWRIIEIWDSREGLDRFIEEDLAPAIEQASGGHAETPSPEVVFDVHFQGP